MRSRLRYILPGLSSLFGLTAFYLPASNLSLNREVTISYDLAESRMPVWSGGALLAFVSNRTAAPTLLSFDDQGKQLPSISFTVPSSELVDLADIARNVDGAVAVCGKAYDQSGRGAGFIGIIDPGGQQARIVRPYPYYPSRITIGSDGTIWTAGLEVVGGKETGEGVNPQNGVLRHFERGGKLITSLIPRSSLSSPLVAEYGFLKSAKGRVGWYTGPVSGPGSEYYEVFADGRVHKYPSLELQRTEYVTGLALTDDGNSYITTSDNKNHKWRVLVIADRAPEWREEHLPSQLERAVLYGGDGMRLAFFPRDRFKVAFVDVSR